MNLKSIFYHFISLLIAIFCLSEIQGQGTSLSSQDILIRNVNILDRDGLSENVIVSILIKDGKLKLVTKDKISLDDVDIAFDAKGGTLLGKLNIGEQIGFMIVDKNPQEDVDVLLDTKTYTVFAAYQGEIILNKLIKIDAETGEKDAYSSWLFYDPPPIALPLSYQNSRKWNSFKTKPVNIILVGALIIENTRWIAQDEANKEQVGDISMYEGGSIRGLRVGVGGTINFKKPWTYTFSAITNAYERGFETGNINELIFGDYRLSIPIGKVSMTIGKQKEPISMQRIIGMVFLPDQQERSTPADGLMPSRNTGIAFNGTFVNSRMAWAAGAFNRWFDAGQSFSETSSQFIGRVTGLPFLSDDESNLFHIGIGGRYTNAKEGIRYKALTEIFRGPRSLDTELINANNAFTYMAEIGWRKGPFLLQSEIYRSRVDVTAGGALNFGGYYITASYVITGEMRPYIKRSGVFSKLKPSKNVNSGGLGAWEVFTRWSSLNLDDKDIVGGKMNTFSIGLAWWANANVQTSLNYRYSTLERFGTKGSNQGIVTRLVLIL